MNKTTGGVMAYAFPGAGALDYFPCQYGTSRVLFRGPRCDTTAAYLAMLGGSETYGRYVADPFATLVGRHIGVPVANLGCVNAGPDVFLNEPAVLEVAAAATVTIVQVLGAQNLSNRFYTVHPRRNDRFLGATPQLRAIFRDVDFTEFHFTRHLLKGLQATSIDRFEVVAEELKAAWVARMKLLLSRVSGRSVLVWIADAPPPGPSRRANLSLGPILIDAEMIAAIRPLASDYVQVVLSPSARARGTEGMVCGPMEVTAAAGLPGPWAHQEIAAALLPAIRALI